MIVIRRSFKVVTASLPSGKVFELPNRDPPILPTADQPPLSFLPRSRNRTRPELFVIAVFFPFTPVSSLLEGEYERIARVPMISQRS